MNQEGNPKNNSLLDKIKQIILVVGTIVGVASGALVIIQGADAYIRSHKPPSIIVTNYLALPIIVEVNDSAAYQFRIEAGSQKTITLFSESDFPAKIHWYVIQNKNTGGEVIGEALSGDFSKIDKGREIGITHTLGANVYFYPVIKNNSDYECLIIINDGLVTKYTIGISNPHKITSLTGYFKYAKNSNVTLVCNNKPYWRGVRNKQSSMEALPIQANSGITQISFP